VVSRTFESDLAMAEWMPSVVPCLAKAQAMPNEASHSSGGCVALCSNAAYNYPMQKLVFILVSIVVVTSCQSIEPQPFRGPNGKPAYSMTCSGGGRTMDGCYKKAGELCPEGYSIVDRTSSVVGSGGSVVTRQGMAIECK